MSEITAWLENLGLAQYGKAFIENDIDLEVLPELSDQDLRELGLSLGHRRKLLKAAAVLTEAGDSVGDTKTGVLAAQPSPAAERRQLTVMFVDPVGSTETIEH